MKNLSELIDEILGDHERLVRTIQKFGDEMNAQIFCLPTLIAYLLWYVCYVAEPRTPAVASLNNS